jgi:PKD domain-containing protein
MKWTYIVILSLLVSILPALPYTGADECLRLMSVQAPLDLDNDGVTDEYDALIAGNAVVIISIDSLDLNGTWDPNIGMALDGGGNGALDVTEWRNVIVENVSDIENSGYGEGDLWYGVDINDNTTSILFGVNIYNGTWAEDGFFDLSPEKNQTAVVGEFFMRNVTERTYRFNVSSSGEGDNETGLGDAVIEFHVEVIMGPTIIEADPPPTKYLSELVTVEINEGDSKLFTIEEAHFPEEAGVNISYEWYLGVFENLSSPPIDHYCVQNSSVNVTDQFELYANFGSEGFYGLYCIAFLYIGEMLPYWYDMKAWGIRVDHHNTVPQPKIDVTPDEWITQLDSVSISGWKSYDRDGDNLTYRWFIDDVYVSDLMEFEHVFINAGLHSIRLEATDDENATGILYRNITVNNIPTPDGAVHYGDILETLDWMIQNNYSRTLVDRRSVSTNLELPFGYGLIASFSLVSETVIEHFGSVDLGFQDLGTNYTYNMTSSDDTFSVKFKPYFDMEFIILKDDKKWELINGTIPIPLQNNDLGLDGDGDPILEIPTLTLGLVDVYTWDLYREIYNGSDGEMGSISVLVDDIDMLEVDLFRFASAILGLVINEYAFLIGEAFHLLDVFANLYMINQFDVSIDIQQEYYFLIDHHGSDHNDLELYVPGSPKMPSGSQDDRDIYLMTAASLEVGMVPSLTLKFKLTEWGKSAYGTYNTFDKSGIIVGIVNTIHGFLKTGAPPKKDYTFEEKLWQGETSLKMSGDVSRIHGSYLTYSSDIDDDGVINLEDHFPLDAAAWLDTDGDGMPDELHGNSTTGLIEDEDDDNDGVPDVDDEYPKDPARGGEDDPQADRNFVLILIGVVVIILVATLFLLVWFNKEDEGKSWGKDEE